MAGDSTMADTESQAWYLKSKFPVYWPECEALTMPEDEFQAYLARIKKNGLKNSKKTNEAEITQDGAAADASRMDDDTFTLVSEQQSTTADLRVMMEKMDVDATGAEEPSKETQQAAATGHPFMDGLLSHAKPKEINMEGKMLTENGDLAYRSTDNALLDLFTELEDVISGPRLRELLDAAWREDPATTLRLIFNARSIHIGKSSRHTFYRCAGWLAQNHPLTLAANLQWLSRPVIEKKVVKKDDADTKGEKEGVMVLDESDPARFDVRHGVSHGYWKDMLNLLALSANGDLNVIANPRDILNIENEKEGPKVSKEDKREKQRVRHECAVEAFESYPAHHALHLTVARLFAAQLRADLELLQSEDKKKRKTGSVSMCAKWAPSLERFHDKHTFVASSIAEIMFPVSHFPPDLVSGGREVYLRYAREEYRRCLSRLRAHLDIVERHLSTKTVLGIDYATVPSMAMRAYGPIFAEHDYHRFGEYLEKVKDGSSQISGAVLLPSVLVRDAFCLEEPRRLPVNKTKRAFWRGKRDTAAKRRERLLKASNLEFSRTNGLVLDAQWNTLVKRVKESGSMESCIAVCDVSGSMFGPQFADGTCPMHSAVGLSLLMAEVVAPPFGGAFITFADNPKVEKVDLSKPLGDKVVEMSGSDWGGSTDLVKVFEDLILPMALENKLTQEQMVKRVFVFSDMHFNQAEPSPRFQTSFERIQVKYKRAGYEIPELVFWNLAGGRAGVTGEGDPVASKPAQADQKGVALVSGYSQGLLKVFMDKGMFDEEEEEELVETVTKGEDGEEVVEVVKKKKELTPVTLMKKAISHKAYEMLTVVD